MRKRARSVKWERLEHSMQCEIGSNVGRENGLE